MEYLKDVCKLSNNTMFIECCNSMVDKNISFFKTIKKKFLSNEFTYNENSLKESYESIALVYSIVDNLLNPVQSKRLETELNGRISVMNFLQKSGIKIR